MDRNHFAIWLDAYVEAWRSNERELIERLFSDDARYYYNPLADPVVGRRAIADSWLAQPDDPDTFDAHYAPLAIDGEIYVASGETTYFQPGTRELRTRFANVFVCRFDEHGRCREFCEWFMEAPKPKS
jgi:hypothetical protein